MSQKKEQITGERSARSRSAFLKEKDLRIALDKIDKAIAETEAGILRLEATKKETTTRIFHGQGNAPKSLDSVVTELAKARIVLDAFKQERADTLAAIEKLALTPAQVQARIGQQLQFATFARKRLEKARKVDGLLKELRDSLREQIDLGADMSKCAVLLELDLPNLDTSRFEDLLASLPEEMSSMSERWCAAILGKRKDVRPYIVTCDHLEIDETLADHGIYEFGETILLGEEEARELLREDRPVPGRRFPWECLPARVMTVEAYEAAIAEAKEQGISVSTVLLYGNNRRAEQAREGYEAKQGASITAA